MAQNELLLLVGGNVPEPLAVPFKALFLVSRAKSQRSVEDGRLVKASPENKRLPET